MALTVTLEFTEEELDYFRARMHHVRNRAEQRPPHAVAAAALAAVARSVADPREVTEVNVMGTLNVLVAAREARARRVVSVGDRSVRHRIDQPSAPRPATGHTCSTRSPRYATIQS